MQMDFSLHRPRKHGNRYTKRILLRICVFESFSYLQLLFAHSESPTSVTTNALSNRNTCALFHQLTSLLFITQNQTSLYTATGAFSLFDSWEMCFFIWSVIEMRELWNLRERPKHLSSSSKTNSRNKHLNQRCLEKSPILIRPKYLFL